MKTFFSSLLGTIIGLFIFFFFGFLIILGIGMIAGSGNKPSVKENSVLKLTLSGEIVEMAEDNPFEDLDLPAPFNTAGKTGLIQLLKAIKSAETDGNIKGIYLELTGISAGYATIEEIRNALTEFKQSGKFIIAYSEIMSEKAYYLTTVADQIHLYPSGGMELNGLSSEITFFKGLFEKLGIEPVVFKVGDFKSAVEPFIRKDMSEPNRLQVSSFLNSLNNYQIENISKSINKKFDEIKLISDSMLVRDAKDALKYGLVHKLSYFDEVENEIRTRLKLKDEKEKINYLNLSKYTSTLEKESSYGKDKIAVIIAEGEIVSGKSSDGNMGSETIAEEIKKARLDDKVKAVVLRVNSPGGSALASDVMWREVVLCKKAKPIIASMSDVAASGGYYISMACDTIVAYPNTITGSIGVFGMWFNIGKFLEDKVGITTDRVKTGLFSDLGSMTRELTEYEQLAIQKQVEDTYEEFTSKAAEGRNMSIDDLKKVASGRVWTGLEAKQVGLVDVLGDLNTAIELAAVSAKLDSNYSVKYFPEQKDFFEELMNELSGDVMLRFLSYGNSDIAYYTKQAEKLNEYKGIQLRSFINAKTVE